MTFKAERDESKAASSIKVVDRRRFTSSGEGRPDAPPLEAKKTVREPVAPAPERRAAPAPAPEPQTPEHAPDASSDAGEQEAVDFLSFVASLATNAMAALGMLPEHERQGMPRSPEVAREYIEIIAMLERRTRGNLNAQEAKTLTRLLGDLRMGYVEATRSVQPAQMSPEMMRSRS